MTIWPRLGPRFLNLQGFFILKLLAPLSNPAGLVTPPYLTLPFWPPSKANKGQGEAQDWAWTNRKRQ